MKALEKLDNLKEQDFITNYMMENLPVVVRYDDFDVSKWTPEYFKLSFGKMQVQVYDALFDLQEIVNLESYIDKHFNSGAYENVPYIRWYSRLKKIDFYWADEAFRRMGRYWKKPEFIPDRGFMIPALKSNQSADPVRDLFPYRGLLISAKGARTRLHRDPFCSDAVIVQLYGVKEVALYRPERAEELKALYKDNTSFGGFIDVRSTTTHELTHVPDFVVRIAPGEAIYIPNGWLHDVVVKEDSISVTWNFIHESASTEYLKYLRGKPKKDKEFAVLQYFYSLHGDYFDETEEIVEKYCKDGRLIKDQLAS